MEYGISFPIQGNKNPPNRKSSLRDHERPVSQTAKSARDSRAGNEGMSTGQLYSDGLNTVQNKQKSDIHFRVWFLKR